MLKVFVPPSCRAESRWICGVLLGEFLGVPVEYVDSADGRFRIEADGKALQFDESPVLGTALNRSLPGRPLVKWDATALAGAMPLVDSRLPVLYGRPDISVTAETIRLGLDVFGSAFFMLSRLEEIVLPDRDAHNRFPAAAALSRQEGFLDRPIVDEYVEVLWGCMNRLWPTLARRRRRGRTFVTCDVDIPYDANVSTAVRLAKRVAGDLLKRRSPGEALRSMRNAAARRRGDWSQDPHNTFGWMMDACEQVGHRAAFYFIPDNRAEPHHRYELTEPYIQGLLREIHRRGHEIGMHGSYNSYNDAGRLVRERSALVRACQSAGADQPVTGNRQHYLQWDSALTPSLLEQAGFEYDTTGSYADCAGFRYGTGHSFPMWDWRNRRASTIRQRPLIVMEESVIDASYAGMGHTETALETMLDLKRRCLMFGGEFVLLWHNTNLRTEADRRMYLELLRVNE